MKSAKSMRIVLLNLYRTQSSEETIGRLLFESIFAPLQCTLYGFVRGRSVLKAAKTVRASNFEDAEFQFLKSTFSVKRIRSQEKGIWSTVQRTVSIVISTQKFSPFVARVRRFVLFDKMEIFLEKLPLNLPFVLTENFLGRLIEPTKFKKCF